MCNSDVNLILARNKTLTVIFIFKENNIQLFGGKTRIIKNYLLLVEEDEQDEQDDEPLYKRQREDADKS